MDTHTCSFSNHRLIWLLRIAFTNRLAPKAAEVALARIKTGGMGKVSLSFIGSGAKDSPTYWRVQGAEFIHSLKDTQPSSRPAPRLMPIKTACSPLTNSIPNSATASCAPMRLAMAA